MTSNYNLSTNKILELISTSPYEGAWIDYEGNLHTADLGYVYDFFNDLCKYLDEHPEHLNKLIDKK